MAQLTKFGLVRYLFFLMMCFLLPNVSRYAFNLGLSYRKSSITSLPVETAIAWKPRFYPNRAIAFYFSDQCTNIQPTERYQKMDVVGGSVSNDQSPAIIRDYSADVFKKLGLDRGRYNWGSILGGKDDVN